MSLFLLIDFFLLIFAQIILFNKVYNGKNHHYSCHFALLRIRFYFFYKKKELVIGFWGFT